MQPDEPGNLSFEAFHAFGESVAQAFDDLKQRQIDITEAAADDDSAAILFQHALEIAEIFRYSVAPEILGSPPRGRALLLEIEPARDRMMGIVDLIDEVGNCELQLMRPQEPGFVARGKLQTRTEKQQDIRGLRHDGLARFQERRRVGRVSLPAIR